jgi:hypothetical protein
MAMCLPRGRSSSFTSSRPSDIDSCRFGAITYTWPRSIWAREVTWVTGMRVARWMISAAELGCVGDRCRMITKAMSWLAGMCSNNFMSAGRPPAEAPMPTTGKSSVLSTTPCSVGGVLGASAVSGMIETKFVDDASLDDPLSFRHKYEMKMQV